MWNKERFVNAQYRFVMNPNGDYTVHFADPDIYFQWQDILQVIVPRVSRVAADSSISDVEGLTTCPICLSPPTAPRMTKCGHVFCLPCILHYLSSSENKWARCPICFDSVNERQLKCVKWYEGVSSSSPSLPLEGPSSAIWEPIIETTPQSGSTLRMRLMQRPQITTLALPRSQTWPSDLLPPHKAPFHFLPDVYNFSKFMLATPDYLIGDLSNELDQLAEEKRVMGGMKDELSVYFLTGAEEKVREQMEKAAALETSLLKEQIEKAMRDRNEIQDKAESRQRKSKAVAETPPPANPIPESEVPQELLAVKSSHSGLSSPSGVEHRHVRPNAPRPRRNVNPPPPSTSTYYYYQAASGLPIFLHPLDIKILLSRFGGYPSFPDEIAVRVEACSEGTVNDDLRKRCKYIAHLPESADVIFVEADLEGVVGVERLKDFEKPLKMRSAQRHNKTRKDDRAKARAEEREREREMQELSRFMPRVSHSSTIPISENRDSGSPSHHDGSPSAEVQSNESSSPPVPSGAWGNRSFASALHSSGGRSGTPGRRRNLVDDEWDIEGLWQDFEQKSINNAAGGGSGKKNKKSSKMVVLGGGGSGVRRR